MATDSPSTDETRQDRKERYEALLRCVDHNTSPAQLPGAAQHAIVVILGTNGRFDSGGVYRSIQAARENDDLVRWRGPDGTKRLTRTTKEDLRRAAAYACEEMEDPQALQTINRVYKEVRDRE